MTEHPASSGSEEQPPISPTSTRPAPRSYAAASVSQVPPQPPKPPAYWQRSIDVLVPSSPSIMDAVPAASFFNSTPAPEPRKKIPVKSAAPVYIAVSDKEEEDELMEETVEPIQLKRSAHRMLPGEESWRETAYQPYQPSDAASRNIASSSKLIKSYSPPSAPPELPVGGGWTTSKLLAMQHEGGGIEGIWKSGVADFQILPYSDALPAPGTLVQVKRMNPPTPEDAEEQDIIIEELEEEGPKMLATITQLEMDAVRPHTDAFFSRSTYSWVIFTRLLPNSPPAPVSSDLPSNRPHLWRIVPDSVSPESVGLGPIFAPANPAILSANSSVDEADLHVRNFHRLCSAKAPIHFAYSLEGAIPTVIPIKLWKAFEELRSEPIPGDKGKNGALASAWSAVWRSLHDRLLKAETRPLKTEGKFARRMPWDSVTKDLFLGIFGCTFHVADGVGGIHFPDTSLDTKHGRRNRARLLRCWLEIGLVIEDLRKRFPHEVGVGATLFTTSSARMTILPRLGGDDLARIPPETIAWSNHLKDGKNPAADQYHCLGVTPDLADDVLIAVYTEQVLIDPETGPAFLDAIANIAQIRSSDVLNLHVVMEKSKGRYTLSDINEAYVKLGCDPTRGTTSEDFVMEKFHTALESATDADARTEIKQSLKLIAEVLGSDMLITIHSTIAEEERPLMDIEKAYRSLNLAPGVDENHLLAVYGIRIEDQPNTKTAMEDALRSIAEATNSEALRYFLKTGDRLNAWEAAPSISLDRPVGLTNIANTCYLNSLLQYFFTVRELRDAILQFPTEAATPPTAESGTLRVGGRLVTEAEVARSKRFVLLLQTLYNQLIYSPTTSVTPITELAYLALVPSKEETDLIAKSQSQSQANGEASTSKTSAPSSEETKSPTVLGKRTIEHLDEGLGLTLEPMMLDSSGKSPLGNRDVNTIDEDVTMISTDVSTSPSATSPREGENGRQTRRKATPSGSLLSPVDLRSATMEAKEGMDGVVEIGHPSDVEMSLRVDVSSNPVPPPLPPRNGKGKESNLELEVSNYMAFGKQNDVTECMDNVMFQIECALAPSSAELESETSLVKRLFYGMMKQTLELDDREQPEAVRVKDEPFAYLLVDVSSEGRNLYDGLDMVFDSSLVSIDGKNAHKRMSLVDVPPILQIQMQRVQYDKVEQKIFKSNAYMKFGDRLCMDRYLEVEEGDEEGLRKRDRTNEHRREIEKARARLEVLTNSKIPMAQTLRDTFLHLARCRPVLAEVLSVNVGLETLEEAKELEKEVVDLELVIKTSREAIESLWKEDKKAEYELVSVFMHRGTALSGHYWVYQRDSTQTEKWLKYNDSLITDVDPKEEVFNESTGDSNPYFLVWVRSDRLDAIESIKRELQPGN